eukprot:gene16244-22115_t
MSNKKNTFLSNNDPIKTSTEHIHFDKNYKTFRLYAGNSLYAFSISPELVLEHLYWGKVLAPGYDLRYLSQSSRLTHFNTLEVPSDIIPDAAISESSFETLEQLQQMWRNNKDFSSKSESNEDIKTFQKRRLANFSWRAMSQLSRSNDVDVSEKYDPNAILQIDTFDVNDSNEDMQDLDQELPLSRNRATSFPAIPYHLKNQIQSPLKNIMKNKTFWDTLPNKMKSSHQKSHLESFSTSPSNLNKHIFPHSANRFKLDKSTPRSINPAFERTHGTLGKGSICVEYSDHGTGDFRTPSFLIVDNFNGSSISPLRYKSHRILKGKVAMPDAMPEIRCLNDNEASTLIVTMGDIGSGLEVDLIYVAMHDYDVITRRVVYRNVDHRIGRINPIQSYKSDQSLFGSTLEESTMPGGMVTQQQEHNSNQINSKVIHKASSFTVDFESPPLPFHMVQLSGSWARERQTIDTKLTHGMQSFGSIRGVSGHEHNPFAVITVGPSNETQGEVKAFSLVYSGNFLLEAELNETGRLRVNMGIHPMGLQWHLNRGGSFSTPEAVLVRSGNGLGGMSRMLHKLFNERLIPHTWADANPPVLLNSWEAKYFNVNHATILELAELAVEVGVDLVVIDDGWFGNREDDKSSLGDWDPNILKFPLGLKALADDINSLGCKLGLWFEPEMVSAES